MAAKLIYLLKMLSAFVVLVFALPYINTNESFSTIDEEE